MTTAGKLAILIPLWLVALVLLWPHAAPLSLPGLLILAAIIAGLVLSVLWVRGAG